MTDYSPPTSLLFVFFFNDTATTEIYTLSLHDALPICLRAFHAGRAHRMAYAPERADRSEEHTSELQSRENLVCRLLLEKTKTISCTYLSLENKNINESTLLSTFRS